MTLREVSACRYVLPLREGGSLPGLLEADDLGTYVVKFRGAGQGPRALVAEIVVAGVARHLGLRVPELVLVDVDPELARAEPDWEVQELLKASGGRNLGMDYLPGALGFELAAREPVDADLAAAVVWLDALVLNVDRTWRNPNLLTWHGRLWLIDHGAALYFHHDWERAPGVLGRPLRGGEDHALLPLAGPLPAAHERLAPHVTAELVRGAVAAVPADWLAPGDDERYADALVGRATDPGPWLDPLEAARAARV